MRLLWTPDHIGSFLGFAEHGNALVTGSMDGTLRIWRAPSLEQIAAQERAGVVSRLK